MSIGDKEDEVGEKQPSEKIMADMRTLAYRLLNWVIINEAHKIKIHKHPSISVSKITQCFKSYPSIYFHYDEKDF